MLPVQGTYVNQCVKYEENLNQAIGSVKPMLWKMTRSVNLLCVLTRTVNLQDVTRKSVPVRPVCNDKNG